MRALTAALHVIQPLARLRGRLTNGLTPWRHHRHSGFRVPRRRAGWAWSKIWIAPDERLRAVEQHVASSSGTVVRGGPFDRWDLELRGGIFGGARVLMAVEELGGGAQLVRYRFWPIVGRVAALLPISACAVALAAALDGAAFVAVLAGIVAAGFVVLMFVESGAACGVMASALEDTVDRTSEVVVEARNEARESRPAGVGLPQAAPSETQG
jgi:hypothetical protein